VLAAFLLVPALLAAVSTLLQDGRAGSAALVAVAGFCVLLAADALNRAAAEARAAEAAGTVTAASVRSVLPGAAAGGLRARRLAGSRGCGQAERRDSRPLPCPPRLSLTICHTLVCQLTI
jgi:hypothetical protein